MRWSAIVCLLCVTGPLAAPPAQARGGASSAAVAENLLEKGFKLLRTAERHYFSKEFEEARTHGRRAERIFLDVLAQAPNDKRAALLGGQAATLSGDLRSAAQWVGRLKRISPFGEDDPELHYLRAFVHILGEKRPERGLRELKQMYVLNARMRPVERDTLWYLALLDHGRNLLRAGRPEDAIVQFQTGARLARRLGSPTKEMTMQGNVGVALQRSDRWIEAGDLFKAMIKNQPDNPVWHWQYALTLAAQTKFAEAIPVYREVIRLRNSGRTTSGMDEEMQFVHLRLGNCLRNLAERQRKPERKEEMLREAEELIRYFVKLMPEDPLGHKWLGVLLYQNRERPYAALPHLLKAHELDPWCVDALTYAIQIHEHYPPPPDQVPEDDAAAAAAALKAWRAPIAKWRKEIDDSAEERKRVLETRERETGGNGCS